MKITTPILPIKQILQKWKVEVFHSYLWHSLFLCWQWGLVSTGAEIMATGRISGFIAIIESGVVMVSVDPIGVPEAGLDPFANVKVQE